MPNYQSATLAYGRDYKSQKAVKEDWEQNKDFILQPSGQTISKSCKPADMVLNIRYSHLTKVCVIK